MARPPGSSETHAARRPPSTRATRAAFTPSGTRGLGVVCCTGAAGALVSDTQHLVSRGTHHCPSMSVPTNPSQGTTSAQHYVSRRAILTPLSARRLAGRTRAAGVDKESRADWEHLPAV